MLYGQEPPGLLNNPLGPTSASASVLMRGSPVCNRRTARGLTSGTPTTRCARGGWTPQL